MGACTPTSHPDSMPVRIHRHARAAALAHGAGGARRTCGPVRPCGAVRGFVRGVPIEASITAPAPRPRDTAGTGGSRASLAVSTVTDPSDAGRHRVGEVEVLRRMDDRGDVVDCAAKRIPAPSRGPAVAPRRSFAAPTTQSPRATGPARGPASASATPHDGSVTGTIAPAAATATKTSLAPAAAQSSTAPGPTGPTDPAGGLAVLDQNGVPTSIRYLMPGEYRTGPGGGMPPLFPVTRVWVGLISPSIDAGGGTVPLRRSRSARASQPERGPALHQG